MPCTYMLEYALGTYPTPGFCNVCHFSGFAFRNISITSR
jgi:hypothetical protein